MGVGISWHLTIRFRFGGQRFDSKPILDSKPIIDSKTICDATRFLKHLSLTQSLKSLPTLCLIIKENQLMNYLLYFLFEKKLFLVTIMTFNEQCNNRCSLHFNTKWMCKKKKSIMNFSESKQNRSRENREKSKNRFFFPPLVTMVIHKHCTLHIYIRDFILSIESEPSETTIKHTETHTVTHTHTHTQSHTQSHTNTE